MATAKITDKNNDKRKAILDASLKLFCEKCYQETSTASISKQANVATGTLFLYFENKEALVNELYLESKDEYASYVEEGLWENPNFKTRLKHIWDRSLDWKLSHPDKIKFMMQFCSSPAITKLTREKAFSRMVYLNDVVQQAIKSNEITVASPDLLPAMISGYFHCSSMHLMEKKANKNFKKWREEAFEYLWRGIH